MYEGTGRAQAAMELVTEVERAVERYCQGMGHLGRQLPLPGPPQLLLVTHRRPADAAAAGAAEAVVHCQPCWGTSIPAPASWDAAAASPSSPEVLLCPFWMRQSWATC